jgi:hypothetical protein
MTPHLLSRRRGRRPPRAAVVVVLTTAGALGLAAPATANPAAPAPAPTANPDWPALPSTPPGAPAAANQTAPAFTKDRGTGATGAQAASIKSALAQAAKTGRDTPIGTLTDEYSTTSANPNGSLTTIYSSSPDRVRQQGRWVPVDTTLVRHADGTYGPKAALTPVSFGAGGDRDLVTMHNGAHALNFTWDKALPKPVVSGATATYDEVLPGVDLKVTASATGYSSVFVVKTAQAAASAGVQEMQLGLTGTHVKIAQLPGGAQATDALSGGKVFQAGTALMWDSTPSATEPPVARVAARAGLADAESPGGHRAEVKIGISAGRQTLTLDKAMLSAKTTKFPVYVDPDWSAWTGNPSQMKWARISSNGWNVYNSTATTGANSARVGLDDWPADGGDGETARTFYQMNTSGIKGATVQSAYLYITNRWAASCSNTGMSVYATGSISGWDSSHLSWSKQPSRGALQGTQNSEELSCGGSKAHVTPPTFKFTVTKQVTAAASAKAGTTNFMAVAANENDRMDWKQLGYKGGARLSVNYSYRPTVDPENGKQHVFPSVLDLGKTMTTSGTPTLSWTASNKFPNGTVRNLMVDYHVLDKTGKLVAYGYGPGSDKYSLHGSSWTVTPKLADGDYTYIVSAKNQDGLWASAWSSPHPFTVDTKAPKAPFVKSTQFPENQVGARYSDPGVFGLSNDRSDDVTGYLFSMDGDLSNVTYAGTKGTAWTTGTAIKPGTIYFAKADNATGTGTVVVNGSAGVSFAPGSPGPHRIFAKAVDQGGTTSPQTTYVFNAGRTAPTYAYGDKMVAGYTATNDNGSTTVVPAATTTSKTGSVISQKNSPGYFYADGFQAFLGNKSTTSKVANGDTMTLSFDLPHAGAWDIGANLTTASDYGTYSLTLDQGQAGQTTLLPSFDAYSSPNTTQYRDFGLIKDGAGNPLTLSLGVHTVTIKLLGTDAKSAGYQAGVDTFRLAPQLSCSLFDTSSCLNNKGISTRTPGGSPAITAADADGQGFSFDEGDFANAGWKPGQTVQVDGTYIDLPSTMGTGQNDNMLSDGQYITVPNWASTGNALVLLGWSVNGDTKGATGQITYAPDSGCNVNSQTYTMDSAPDWAWTPQQDAVLSFDNRNHADGTADGLTLRVTAISVPLLCPGSPISLITLPVVSESVDTKALGYHVLGLGLRPTSSVNGDRLVGSWAAAPDITAVQQKVGNTTQNAPVKNQTLRVPARLSMGTEHGGKLRVRLSNIRQLYSEERWVSIGDATVAVQSSGAATTGPPIHLTWGGSSNSAFLSAGTEMVSDPVDLDVPDHGTILITIEMNGNYDDLPGHNLGRQVVYTTPAGDTTDYAANADGQPFTLSTMTGIPLLSAVDVSTPAATPAGAIALYGDQTINSDTASGQGGFTDALATALSTDDTGTAYPMTTGVLNLGSSAANAMLPPVTYSPLPVNARGVVDRELLAQADVRITLLSIGGNDLLACTDTPASCASTVEARLVAMASQLQQYQADDALNYAVDLPSPTRTMKVYVATLPPFTGTHTADQETAREAVNAYLLGGTGGGPMAGYADGVIDFASAVSADNTPTNASVNPDDLTNGAPNDLYFQSLAAEYLQDSDSSDDGTDGDAGPSDTTYPVAQWAFNDNSGSVAADTSPTGTGTVATPALHDATLTGVTWAAGRNVEHASGMFNGTSSYADTGLPLNTGKSFTVSMWVKLADKNADHTFFAKTSTGGSASFTLQYSKADDSWLASMPSAASGNTVTVFQAEAQSTPRTGVWTHLAASYDSDAHRLDLYVDGEPDGVYVDDGELDGTQGGVTPFNDPQGSTWIGRGNDNWFAGGLADVNVWFRALSAPEIETAAQDHDPMVNWQFEDQSLATTAPDSGNYEADGTFTGGVSWNFTGHPNPDGTSGGFNDDLGSIHLDGTGSVTTTARLETDQSFTVAGWVDLTKSTADATVISQAGSHASGFQLKFATACTCWQFVLPATDANSPATVVAASGPAAVGTWTHLAGVYDAGTGQATLYVNGAAAADPTPVTTPQWNATGKFTVGQAWVNGAAGQSVTGDIDDVYAFQETLDADDIALLMADESTF